MVCSRVTFKRLWWYLFLNWDMRGCWIPQGGSASVPLGTPGVQLSPLSLWTGMFYITSLANDGTFVLLWFGRQSLRAGCTTGSWGWGLGMGALHHPLHWLSPFFNMEVKFGSLEKRDKNDWYQSKLNFAEVQSVHRLDCKMNEEILKELKVEPVD
jgi:hypothetical protein